MLALSSNPFHIQIRHTQRTCFFNVDSINPHKGIHHGLAAVGRYGVAHAVAWHINGHPFFYTDAVSQF